MKKALFFALVLAVFCGMASCHKDENEVRTITYGDYTGMRVKTYDQSDIIQQDSFCWIYPIDFVSLNFQAELLLYMSLEPIPGSTNAVSYFIRNNNLAELQCDYNLQMYYRHIDTIAEQTDSLFYLHVYDYDACEMIADDDEPLGLYDNISIIGKDKDEQLSNEAQFVTNNKLLLYVPYNETRDSFWIGNDSVEIVHMVHDHHCYKFPTGEEKYIGVKVTKNGREHLGWIKLLIHPGGMIDLIETAIQK